LTEKPLVGTLDITVSAARRGEEAELPEISDIKIDSFYVAVGKKVRIARSELGLSQTALADRIGFKRASIANLEAGRQRIALHLFILIAQALGVEPGLLLPDTSILDYTTTVTAEDLTEQLIGAPESTHEFVRGAVAQVSPESMRERR
jgi:transcriptional regulator with XRE-family HTH domain